MIFFTMTLWPFMKYHSPLPPPPSPPCFLSHNIMKNTETHSPTPYPMCHVIIVEQLLPTVWASSCFLNLKLKNWCFIREESKYHIKWGNFDKWGDFDNCCYFVGRSAKIESLSKLFDFYII